MLTCINVSCCAWQDLNPSWPVSHPLDLLMAHRHPHLIASQIPWQWRRRCVKAVWPVFATSYSLSIPNWLQWCQTPGPCASVQFSSWPGCASLWANCAPTWSIAFWESRVDLTSRPKGPPGRARSWAKPGLLQRSAHPRPSGWAWRRSFLCAVWRPTASGAPLFLKSDTITNIKSDLLYAVQHGVMSSRIWV